MRMAMLKNSGLDIITKNVHGKKTLFPLPCACLPAKQVKNALANKKIAIFTSIQIQSL